jgi:uncharacterized membrane protein HdeD (DUF308 family)
MAGFCLVFAELKFESLLWHFHLLEGPSGKGFYCLFLATFYVNDAPKSLMFIINIVVFCLGICYIMIGLFCRKKNEVVPITTTNHAEDEQ